MPAAEEASMHLTMFIVKICRKMKLFPNERTTILSQADNLQLLQYCLACYTNQENSSKKNEPETVLELRNELNKLEYMKMSTLLSKVCQDQIKVTEGTGIARCETGSGKKEDITSSNLMSDVISAVSDLYKDFKKKSNQYSILDVYNKFLEVLSHEDSDLPSYILTCEDRWRLEVDLNCCPLIQTRIIKHLQTVANGTVHPKAFESPDSIADKTEVLSDTTFDDGCLSSVSSQTPRRTMLSRVDLPTVTSEKLQISSEMESSGCGDSSISVHVLGTPFSQSERSELQKVFVEDVFRNYLHLLVNSRSQLALARVFNIPDRGLDHHTFTHLKHEAQKNGLSMYQTLASFLLRIQLGGKSYAPLTDNPLMEHVKGLGSLLDLVQKLQTIIEEDPVISSACCRVINIIKSNLICCKTGRFPRSVVEPVSDSIHQVLANFVKQLTSNSGDTPDKAVSSGGSVAGHKSIRVIHWYLDRSALMVSHLDHHMMRNIRFSSETPTRFPCLLSQFRSPAALELEKNDACQDLELQAVDTEKNDKRPNTLVVSSALYLDSKHDLDLICTQGTLSNAVVIPSKTIVHPKEGSDTCGENPKVVASSDPRDKALRTIDGKIKGRDEEKKTKGKRNMNISKGKENLNHESIQGVSEPKQSRGSGVTQAGCGESPRSSKVSVKQRKGGGSVSCRRRLLPQVKGQAKITGFFRL